MLLTVFVALAGFFPREMAAHGYCSNKTHYVGESQAESKCPASGLVYGDLADFSRT